METENCSSARSRDKRNYGIGLLRLYAMFLIVVLHVLGPGGVLNASSGWAHHTAWLLEIGAYCAVDCYALISGYVGCTKTQLRHRVSKYLSLWCPVFLYSFGVSVCAFFIKPGLVETRSLLQALFPVATNQYWYFSSYTALFFLIPWLNRLIQTLKKQELTGLVVLLAGMFSLYMLFAERIGGDPFVLTYGYSTIWLIALYIFGAWMKQCCVVERVSVIAAVVTLCCCILITWTIKQFLPSWIGAGVLVSYTSPMNLLIAMSYLCIFAKLDIPRWLKMLIAVISPAAFGVYLIHVQPVIWNLFIENAFVRFAEASVPMMTIGILGCAIAIFFICIAVELFRIMIFRLLHIEFLFEKIGDFIERCVYKVLTTIEKLIDFNK